MPRPTQLSIDVRPGEQLVLDNGRIVVELMDKSGKLAKLRLTAPAEVRIERKVVEAAPRAMRDEMSSS